MLLEHQGKRPHIHETAYIAPTATVCGDVTIGAESRVLFGAVLVANFLRAGICRRRSMCPGRRDSPWGALGVAAPVANETAAVEGFRPGPWARSGPARASSLP